MMVSKFQRIQRKSQAHWEGNNHQSLRGKGFRRFSGAGSVKQMTDSLPGLIVMIFAAHFLKGFDGVFRRDNVLISRMNFFLF